MASDDPNDEPMAHETLRRLERRLDAASEAAERLIAEAAASAARSASEGRPPPAGWQIPSSGASGDGQAVADDLELLARFVRSVRELIPPDLQRRLAEALRELLLALRALIDWYLERIERRRAEPVEVQDIPIL
jgi:hypothetical protein